MRKQCISVILIATMCLSLFACGVSDAPTTAPETTKEPTQTVSNEDTAPNEDAVSTEEISSSDGDDLLSRSERAVEEENKQDEARQAEIAEKARKTAESAEVASEIIAAAHELLLAKDGEKVYPDIAIELLEPLAAEGIAEAEYLLGYTMLFYFTPTDEEELRGQELLTSAADKGIAKAAAMLAVYLKPKTEGSDAIEEPLTDSVKKALFAMNDEELGDDGQFILGNMYLNGLGCEQDFSRAIELFESSAMVGNHLSMFCLGANYMIGWGIETDSEKALDWFRLSAQAGNVTAMQYAAELCLNNQEYEEALLWNLRASLKGSSDAMTVIGVMCSNGLGMEQNYEKAIEWFLKAVYEHNAEAMYNIGFLYLTGNGMEQDYAKAMEWMQASSTAGDPYADYTVGFLFENGFGTEQDYDKAMEWYIKAADAGVSEAMERICELYESGLGVEVDSATDWYNISRSWLAVYG